MARVEIEIEDQLLDELSEALFWEQERDTSQRRSCSRRRNKLEIATGDEELISLDAAIVNHLIVARVDGLSIKIWADEHRRFQSDFQGIEESPGGVEATVRWRRRGLQARLGDRVGGQV